jgi:putative DNA primase/helicase
MQIKTEESSEGVALPRPEAKVSRKSLIIYDANDDGNAEAFAEEYADQVRYDHARKRWLVWQAHWWKHDSDAAVLRMVADLVKRRYRRAWDIADAKLAAETSKFMQRSRDERRLRACLALAASKKPLASDGQEWDANPWLFGVANGIVNLQTGELRAGKPEDNITKHSLVEFDQNATCPRWMQFLDEVFIEPNGRPDRDLIDYIHRAVGYTLTGHVNEQVWFFCQGGGRNGKSVFLDTLQSLFGADYARSLPFDELTQKKFGHSHPVGLSHLEGARYIVAAEGAKHAAFDDQRLKLLTGGETIVARGMRENFREFDPTFKVWLAANHQLQIHDRTEGFWRRIRILRFSRRFDDRNADLRLEEKLQSELSGILNWAIQGCLKWQKQGLARPACIENAIQEYRYESDIFSGFFNDYCRFSPGAFASSGEVQQAYSKWQAANPEAPVRPDAAFYDSLKERGARIKRTQDQRGWLGVQVIDPARLAYIRFIGQHGENEWVPSWEEWQAAHEWQQEQGGNDGNDALY